MTVVALHAPAARPEPTPAPNRRALAKAETRAKVLDAARFLFLNVGYFGTTIRDVAARTGMSTGALFNTVQDKAELWREACGGPPPSEQLAEEVAMVQAGFPGWRWSLNAVKDGGFVASILTPDWAPISPGMNAGAMFHGRGDSPATAVREARIEAERALGANGVRRWAADQTPPLPTAQHKGDAHHD